MERVGWSLRETAKQWSLHAAAGFGSAQACAASLDVGAPMARSAGASGCMDPYAEVTPA